MAKASPKKALPKKANAREALAKPSAQAKKAAGQPTLAPAPPPPEPAPPLPPFQAAVLDRLHATILQRRTADPAQSHSARLLARGPAKIAQKFGEEAVECLIEAVAGNIPALVAESADVLYHLLVMWVAAGVAPDQVWAELARREATSGIAEKAGRPQSPLGTTKIP